jgi:hypothetical protein
MMQSEINIKIGKKPPYRYFSELKKQCEEQKPAYGGIINEKEMQGNFQDHCIPVNMETKDIEGYEDFLHQRRKLMSHKIRDYYFHL